MRDALPVCSVPKTRWPVSAAVIASEGAGLLLYEQKEGRGIGLIAKLQAYELQDQGLDTVEANEKLGFRADHREFALPAAVLRAMGITEVVRGADLLRSTARQILIYRALKLELPQFYHCDLVRDASGVRLAKRHDALSIRRLRDSGWTPDDVVCAAGLPQPQPGRY